MDEDAVDESLIDDLPGGALLVGRVEIVRYLTRADDVVVYRAVDADGKDLPLAEVLGMLAVTEHSAVLDWRET